MRMLAFASLVSAALPACATQARTPVVAQTYAIPMTDTGRWGTVMFQIDGSEPQRAIFDSGAGAHGLDLGAAERLNLMGNVTETGVSIQGAGGVAAGAKRITLPNVNLSSLRLGDVSFLALNLAPATRDGIRIDGIIGNQLLSQYSLIFNASAGQLTVTELPRLELGSAFACEPNALGADRAPRVQYQPAINAQISTDPAGGQSATILGVIDTGANRAGMNWPAANALGIDRNHPMVRIGGPGGVGIDGNRTPTSYEITLPYLKVGNRVFRDLELRISDLPSFETLGGVETKPKMLLGMNVLRTMPIAIDKGANRICLG